MAKNKYREAHPEWFDEKGRVQIWVLRALIDYDPDTGVMTWKERGPEWFIRAPKKTSESLSGSFNSRYAGKEALISLSADGRRVGEIFSVITTAAQVAFAIGNGLYPEKYATLHDERYGLAISNINDTGVRQRGAKRGGSSHYFGVSKVSGNWWHAATSIEGKKHNIGRFATEDAAAAAYNEYVVKNIGADVWINEVPDGYEQRELAARRARMVEAYSNGSSRYRGVCFNKSVGKWQASMRVEACSIYIGRFTTEHDAADAYDKEARKYFGPTAFQNNAVRPAPPPPEQPPPPTSPVDPTPSDQDDF